MRRSSNSAVIQNISEQPLKRPNYKNVLFPSNTHVTSSKAKKITQEELLIKFRINWLQFGNYIKVVSKILQKTLGWVVYRFYLPNHHSDEWHSKPRLSAFLSYTSAICITYLPKCIALFPGFQHFLRLCHPRRCPFHRSSMSEDPSLFQRLIGTELGAPRFRTTPCRSPHRGVLKWPACFHACPLHCVAGSLALRAVSLLTAWHVVGAHCLMLSSSTAGATAQRSRDLKVQTPLQRNMCWRASLYT